MNKLRNKKCLVLSLIWTVLLIVPFAGASDMYKVRIEIKQHLFVPSIIRVPTNRKIRLEIFNRDKSSEEFESYPLNREKLIKGGRRAVVFVGPLDPGEYSFFGEFNTDTAQGKLIAVPDLSAEEPDKLRAKGQ